ncbi:hypothetical protein Patl1_12353 [Pistacia atlantica]|uniref:Uncharacterized protein n=1 Tax=Pistacia atlantica TaxID=434234 RepID=A0ACC1AAU5_9ROSI|nr:hypothetical protein Patl1_12353 [Pistacia atlantica]
MVVLKKKITVGNHLFLKTWLVSIDITFQLFYFILLQMHCFEQPFLHQNLLLFHIDR